MKKLIFTYLFSFGLSMGFAQKSNILKIDSLPKGGVLLDKGWKWHAGDNPDFAKVDFDDSAWESIDPTQELDKLPQIRNKNVGWFRLHIQLDSSCLLQPFAFILNQSIASEIYLNGRLLRKFGTVSVKEEEIIGQKININLIGTVFKEREQIIAVRFSVQPNLPYFKYAYSYKVFRLTLSTIEKAEKDVRNNFRSTHQRGFNAGMFLLLALFHFLNYFYFRQLKANLYFALGLSSVGLAYLSTLYLDEISLTFRAYHAMIAFPLTLNFFTYFLYLAVWQMFSQKRNFMYWFLLFSTLVGPVVNILWYDKGYIYGLVIPMMLSNVEATRISYSAYKNDKRIGIILVGNIIFFIFYTWFLFYYENILAADTIPIINWGMEATTQRIALISIPFTLSWYLAKENARTSQNLIDKLVENKKLSEEKQQILATQNETLERQVAERTSELKASQNQLIQKEKLASLGELTAGIAHEIQNPLNFVNNFSELSVDLAKELKEEVEKTEIDKELVLELTNDLTQNQEKINHHGKRASSIVKGMLEHSRTSTGIKELTDINKLADEYLRLAYHGLRAKDKSFNADFKTDFDKNLPKIAVIQQDLGRVLLNLFNNAFYAVKDVPHLEGVGHQGKVLVSTQQINNQIIIKVKDNGTGMSEATKAKIFQPFFTTKPTGEGTGLGLSLAYDIITKGHGGTLEVESIEGEGTEFFIKLSMI